MLVRRAALGGAGRPCRLRANGRAAIRGHGANRGGERGPARESRRFDTAEPGGDAAGHRRRAAGPWLSHRGKPGAAGVSSARRSLARASAPRSRVRPAADGAGTIMRATFQRIIPRPGAMLAIGETLDDPRSTRASSNAGAVPLPHRARDLSRCTASSPSPRCCSAARRLPDGQPATGAGHHQHARPPSAPSRPAPSIPTTGPRSSRAIASLQDLGFVVDRADPSLGTVTPRAIGGGLVRFTVTVRAGDATRTIVRASGQLNQTRVSDPAPFQRFYEALSQALFLQVEPDRLSANADQVDHLVSHHLRARTVRQGGLAARPVPARPPPPSR